MRGNVNRREKGPRLALEVGVEPSTGISEMSLKLPQFPEGRLLGSLALLPWERGSFQPSLGPETPLVALWRSQRNLTSHTQWCQLQARWGLRAGFP